MNWFYLFAFVTNSIAYRVFSAELFETDCLIMGRHLLGRSILVRGDLGRCDPMETLFSNKNIVLKWFNDRLEVTVFRLLIIIDEVDSLWPISESFGLILMIK